MAFQAAVLSPYEDFPRRRASGCIGGSLWSSLAGRAGEAQASRRRVGDTVAGGMTMALSWSGEERLMWKLIGKGSRRGSAPLSRASDIARQPLFWGAVAAALALSGPSGRRAALRGGACYGRRACSICRSSGWSVGDIRAGRG